MRALLITIAAGVSLALSTAAQGFGGLAHTAVCEIAFQELKGNARTEVKRLIRLDDEFRYFSKSCTWPDHPRKRGSEHFVNIARDAAGVTEEKKCPLASKCVVTAIEEDLNVLNDDGATDLEKLKALKFLGHWVGDIHQPLHVSFKDDRGGNSIKESGPCRGSLHSVWDTCMFEERFGEDAIEAAIDFHESIMDEQRAEWITSGPVEWANESFQFTRQPSVGYCVMEDGECRYEEGNTELDGHEPKKTVVVNADYISEHAPIISERIKRAGVRLGHLLNQALSD